MTSTNSHLQATGDVVEPTYHRSYAAPDASLVLSSSDGIKFRVHPIIMRMASGVFCDMLTKATDTGETIQLQEKSDILKTLLDRIYPAGPLIDLKGKSSDFIWTLLLAAEKYEIHNILDEIRIRLLSDSYFTENALEAYGMACRFGWKAEMSATSFACLDQFNIWKSWEALEQIDSIHVLKLQRLIETRKYEFSDFLNCIDLEEECCAWTAGHEDDNYRALLVSYMESELNNQPSGESLGDKFWLRDEVTFLLTQEGVEFFRKKLRSFFKLKNLPRTINDI